MIRLAESYPPVAVQPRRGTFVTGVEASDIVNITEVRAELEGYAAELAALRMNGDARAAFVGLALEHDRAARAADLRGDQAAAGLAGFGFIGRSHPPTTGNEEREAWSAKLGKQELTGFQASARGGLVQVRPEGDRVLLGGRAVTVLRGQLV